MRGAPFMLGLPISAVRHPAGRRPDRAPLLSLQTLSHSPGGHLISHHRQGHQLHQLHQLWSVNFINFGLAGPVSATHADRINFINFALNLRRFLLQAAPSSSIAQQENSRGRQGLSPCRMDRLIWGRSSHRGARPTG
jgi:hypothetical protein